MKYLAIAFFVTFFAGCASAPQQPVSLEQGYLDAEDRRVGVVLQTLPKTNLHLPGASCLLCIAAAEAMNASLNKHAESLSSEEFASVAEQLVGRLTEQGVDVVAIEGEIDFKALPRFKSEAVNSAKKDFRNLQATYGVNQLLIIDINRIGMERAYSGYIPSGDPMAVLAGTAYLVDLNDNTYKWYKPISLYKSAEGDWDEAPSYPGLTNAYYYVIETAREAILTDF